LWAGFPRHGPGSRPDHLVGGSGTGGAPGRRTRFAALEIISVSAIFATSTLIAVRTSELPPVFIAPVIAVVAAIVVRHIYSDATKRYRGWCSVNYLAGAGISAALLAAGIFGLWLSEHKVKAYITGGFLLTILGAILGGTFLPYFKSDYEELMNLEGDPALRQVDKQPGTEQYDVARDAWVRLVGYAVSAVASMLVLTVALGPSLGWVDGHQQLPWQPWAAIAAVGALTLPTWGAVVKARRRHPEHGPSAPPTGGSRYAWWSVLSSGAAILVGAAALDNSGVNPFAIAQAALLTAFAAQTMLGNGAWLHTKRLQPAAWCAAVTSCLAVGVLVYCTLTVGIRPRGAAAPVGFSFLAWFVTATVAALIVVTTTCAIYVADGKPYATDYPPADNCGQDSFLLLCMWFVLGWTPQVVFAHVPAGAPERLASIGTILAGFLLLFGPAFLWTLENNDTHVERQRRVSRAAGASRDHGGDRPAVMT